MTSTVSTSYTLIPNQKYRRSNRRSRRFCKILDIDSQSLSTLGDFKALPIEIFQMVLEHLSVKDISMLSMVSKTISSRLINYISTPSGNRRLLQKDFHNLELSGKRQGSCILEHYRALGLLLKRCTLLLPTKDRLKYIHNILSETLTAGWDELECHRVFNFLCELSNLPRKMQTVVSSKPGHVVWQKMIEGPTDETSLKGLADAIKLLYDTEAKEWTADDVISLVDELSVVPREWLMENNARLLILSGNNICFTFMASKAVNGRAVELARLMVFLALVCEKDLYCMDWTVKMMQKVCQVFSTPGEKNNFLQSVENAFAHLVMDMLQSVMSGDRDEEDSSFLNLFHLVNAQANFHKEILYLTLRSTST
ncbi:F-box only protein 47 isoform X2 [Alligator sinensis]|uniref:F-box only protein 47 isoform X2 n=1 Tax=Alligator sinensis TaxID=38654 RepID=A0A3Q0GKJ8_ALLSI|nr:F-box only protein 47 isoform X2 [Alligator sinensis]